MRNRSTVDRLGTFEFIDFQYICEVMKLCYISRNIVMICLQTTKQNTKSAYKATIRLRLLPRQQVSTATRRHDARQARELLRATYG
jgi:hypothetical protein